MDENTLPSFRQTLQEEAFSANQTDSLISASDTPLSPNSQNDEPNVAISPTEQPVKPITAIEDPSQKIEVEESLSAPVILPQYAPLYKMNPDFFGWLTIEGMVIDYPVMHTPDDPEHYMHRAFDGSYSYSGVLFLDGNCQANGDYYLIYGHHMRNGTMFGRLPDYQDEEFCKEHSVICFDTLYEQRKYMVLAAFFSQIYDNGEKGVFRYYEYFDLSDQADFDDYIRQVHAAAIYDTGIEVEYGDELLVLSTCNYHTSNGRFVVVAKRIQYISPPFWASPPFTPFHPFVNRVGVKLCSCIKSSMLGNERYKGEAILPKSFCMDFLTKKTKKNEGELPQYHVRDSYLAIVTSELWDLVQIEIGRRKALGKHYSGGGAFASRVVCGECGGFYGPKVWHSTDHYRTVIWRCNGKYSTSESKREPCRCPHIREDELIQRFQTVIGRVLMRKPVVLTACQEAIHSLLEWDETELERLHQQADGLAGKVRNLIAIKAHAHGDHEAFEQDYKKLVGQHERLVSRIEKAEAEKKDKKDRARKIELYMGLLERQDDELDFDPGLFALFVDKVIVCGTKRDVQLRFILADGSEWEV